MNNIEDAIKRCKELIKPEHSNWIGLTNQSAIKIVLGNLEALCDMQKSADRGLENAKKINEEHRKENADLMKAINVVEKEKGEWIEDCNNLKKKVKELEEENKSKEKAYNDCYCEYKHYKQFDSIPKQKVKDILNEIQEEYDKVQEQFDCIWNKKSKDNYDRYKLQELSAMQQELGFILGKFEKLLEEGE